VANWTLLTLRQSDLPGAGSGWLPPEWAASESTDANALVSRGAFCRMPMAISPRRQRFAAVVIDYRQGGGSQGQRPRDELSVPRHRQDYSSAIGWAAAQPNIDDDRIVLWGSFLPECTTRRWLAAAWSSISVVSRLLS
jgi:hypothetical protein